MIVVAGSFVANEMMSSSICRHRQAEIYLTGLTQCTRAAYGSTQMPSEIKPVEWTRTTTIILFVIYHSPICVQPIKLNWILMYLIITRSLHAQNDKLVDWISVDRAEWMMTKNWKHKIKMNVFAAVAVEAETWNWHDRSSSIHTKCSQYWNRSNFRSDWQMTRGYRWNLIRIWFLSHVVSTSVGLLRFLP